MFLSFLSVSVISSAIRLVPRLEVTRSITQSDDAPVSTEYSAPTGNEEFAELGKIFHYFYPVDRCEEIFILYSRQHVFCWLELICRRSCENDEIQILARAP